MLSVFESMLKLTAVWLSGVTAMATGFRSTSVVTTARPGTEMRVTVFRSGFATKTYSGVVAGLSGEEVVLNLGLVVVPRVRFTGCVFIRGRHGLARILSVEGIPSRLRDIRVAGASDERK